MLPKTLQTDRLLLRPPRVTDAEEIFERYAQDPEVTRYLSWKTHQSVEETREFLTTAEKFWHEQTGFPWLILRSSDQWVLGMIGLRPETRDPQQRHRTELGYVLAHDAWGQGFATEAAQAVIDASLAEEHIRRIWAYCDMENKPSARVLEKVGMTHEGILRRYMVFPNRSPEPRDVYCYALVR